MLLSGSNIPMPLSSLLERTVAFWNVFGSVAVSEFISGSSALMLVVKKSPYVVSKNLESRALFIPSYSTTS